jgi:hypothetical protein
MCVRTDAIPRGTCLVRCHRQKCSWFQQKLLYCYAEEASDADSMQTNTSREELPDGEPMAQAASESTVFPRHAAQLSLHEARDLLDKDHYGLDKVASWSLMEFHLTGVLVINPQKGNVICCIVA